jgi:hypothetical protein
MESPSASRHHSGSCASLVPDLMAACIFSLFVPVRMNPNPSTPVSFHRACTGGRAGA